jgi:alpha-beta hydrolase superfamily lysophospholipase
MTYYQTASGKINAIEFMSPNSRGTVLCIHGAPSDARIFTYVGTKLSGLGYNVVSIDLPGHGKSEGPRGDLDFAACLRSINQIVTEIKKKSRVFIMAHSMGSTFALWYAHSFKNSISGLIILCPYIRINGIKRSDTEPGMLTFLYMLARRMLTPRSTADITKLLPRYAEVSGEEFADAMRKKIVNPRYSYRFMIDIMAMANSKIAELADIAEPVLLLHGQRDRNVYPQVSEQYLKLLKSQKKDLKVFDCDHWFYDALYFDQNSGRYTEEARMKVISTIQSWLASI